MGVTAWLISLLALNLLTVVTSEAQTGGRPGGAVGGGGGNPNAGGVRRDPGGAGGIPPGTGGVISVPTLRIVTDAGILAGETVQAVVAGQNAVNAAPGAGGGANAGGGAALNTTYQWTISGGRITTDSTRPTVGYVADVAGVVALNVVVTANGVATSASSEVIVVSAASAGAMTIPPTVVTNTANLSASVPPAQNADRTFRWVLNGAGAGIMAGQGTNTVTFRPGAPGLLTVTCEVRLQRLVTVPLRSFVVVTGDGAPVGVSVNNGNGGGTYPAGSRVDIFAYPPPAGQVFDEWTGDVAALSGGALASSLPHIPITVPSTPVVLTATYKAAAPWTPITVSGFNPIPQVSPNGTALAYFIPAGARALVVLFHDRGSNAASWFSTPESLTLTRDLVAAGYGVAALNSVNRNTRTWATQIALNNNPDATNVAAALEKFARDGVFSATKPIFFLGVGTGGEAAAQFAGQLVTVPFPIEGAVLYCATGDKTLAVTSRVPQFFALAANDDIIGAAGIAAARENSTLLAGRGVATAVAVNGPSPVHADRFRVLGLTSPTFTTADARAIWTALKSAGLLDANNYLKAVPTAQILRASLPAAYEAHASDVSAQLAIAYAAREFYSDADARVIAFLDNRVANTPVPAPSRLVNLSTRTILAYVGDSFTLGFNIAGAPRATLLIRGIGPALARFGLPGALAAPRLEVNRGGTVIATNEGWDIAGNNAAQIAAAAASVGAFALVANELDSAVLLSLEPGSYTVTLKGLNGTIGDVLAEVYDVSKNGTRLTNLSTLAKINTEGDLLVPGIVLEGNNPRTLMIRAVGPGLGEFGFSAEALLSDPRITVLSAAGQTVATNNNWTQGGANGSALTLNALFPVVGAFALRPANGDAALVNALAPGQYTLQTSAAPLPVNTAQPPVATIAPNQTGSVLVEVYEVP